MARVTILLKDSDNYISVMAEEFHEDDGYLKVYSAQNELVAIAEMQYVKCAYRTSDKTNVR